MGTLCAFVVLSLAGVFGQRPVETVVAGDLATLTVSAPTRLRSGLVYQARFAVDARRPLRAPTLVFADGWIEGMTINTVEPAPEHEASKDGELAFTYPSLGAGDRLAVTLQVQVNATNVGRRPQDVTLRSGSSDVVRAERTVTVFP